MDVFWLKVWEDMVHFGRGKHGIGSMSDFSHCIHSQLNFFRSCPHRHSQECESHMFVNTVRLTISAESSGGRCSSNTIPKHPRNVSYALEICPYVCVLRKLWKFVKLFPCLFLLQSGIFTSFVSFSSSPRSQKVSYYLKIP